YVNCSFSPWSYCYFLHIHIWSVEKSTFWSSSNDCYTIFLPIYRWGSSFDRINGNIYFWCRGRANFFANVQHRSFIHFSFSNYYSTCKIYLIQLFPHSICRCFISCIFVTFTDPLKCGQSRSFSDSQEV